jgi:hypothetical protein
MLSEEAGETQYTLQSIIILMSEYYSVLLWCLTYTYVIILQVYTLYACYYLGAIDNFSTDMSLYLWVL